MKSLDLLATPNGAGKIIAAFALLPGLLACREFVNACRNLEKPPYH